MFTRVINPSRDGGTLRCHYRHRVHEDPFWFPGLSDITSHVDFTAVAEAGFGLAPGEEPFPSLLAERLAREDGPAVEVDPVVLEGPQERRVQLGLAFAVADRRDLLQPQVDEVLINANQNGERYAAFGHRVVPDQIPDFAGPLAGLHTGLLACETPLLVTAPCDSPFLPAGLVARPHVELPTVLELLEIPRSVTVRPSTS